MDRELIICDIKAITNYSDKDFDKKSTEQLFAMRSRIISAMSMYYREIVTFFKEHPDKRTMSDQDLKLLNYNALSDLRNKLGLSKRKVKKTEEGTEVAKKARKAVKGKTTKQLSLDVMISNDVSDTHECMLYMDEIIQMGYGDYTRDELMKIGIIPLDMKKSHLKK